jgi:hypothetical protein
MLNRPDADGAWKECLDRDIYGANTADYCLQARRSAENRPPVSEQAKTYRQ